jgi:DNA-binding CsgD family transcriptional regulator
MQLPERTIQIHMHHHLRSNMSQSHAARAMADFACFVAAQPTMEETAQHLVLTSMRDFETRGAQIYAFHPAGIIALVGSFGVVHPSLPLPHEFSIWEHVPAADAIRQDMPIHFESPAGPTRECTRMTEGGNAHYATSVFPLKLGSIRLGALQLDHLSLPKTKHYFESLSGVCTILGLYLALLSPQSVPAKKSKAFSLRDNLPLRLSTRQSAILQFLSRGFTNPQIAQRIGFSDSTVRQETMVIYRFLGVHDRREAVRAASDRGLLTAVQPANAIG